jgi:AmmeMemoRadiSam system protein B
VAGRWYPQDPKELADSVDGLLAKASTVPVAGEVVALLAPHAGLAYSGAAAAEAWRLVAGGRWDAVLIVGTAHYRSVAGAALYPGAYGTPLGAVALDKKLADALLAASPLIEASPEAHDKDHSIEAQLPFLQRLLAGTPAVALVMNTEELETAAAIGRAIAKAVRGRKVLLVASTDLSHYPPGEVGDAVDRRGLEKLISEETKIPVRVSEDPLTAVVRGTGIILEDVDKLSDVLVSTDYEKVPT